MIDNYVTFLKLYPLFTYAFLAVLFLSIGSFLNVVIYRLPQMIIDSQERNSKIFLKLPATSTQQELNLVISRSHCISCKSMVPFWHNIPLISFIILRGKCAICRQKISWIYPLVEICCLLVSMMAVLVFGLSCKLLYVLPFLWITICLIAIDMRTKILPDCLTLGLLWLGLLANVDGLFIDLPQAIYGTVFAYLSLWIFINFYYLLTGKIGMGGGDFKLFAALGAWFGVSSLPNILIVSAIPGVMFGVIYLLATGKSKNTQIPFGPFLGFAGICFLFIPSMFQNVL